MSVLTHTNPLTHLTSPLSCIYLDIYRYRVRGAPTQLGPLDAGTNQGLGPHSTTPKKLSKSLSLTDHQTNGGGMKGGSKFFLDAKTIAGNANTRKSFNAVSGMSSGLLSSNGSDDGWMNLNTSMDEVQYRYFILSSNNQSPTTLLPKHYLTTRLLTIALTLISHYPNDPNAMNITLGR